jgi:hypothetical protein
VLPSPLASSASSLRPLVRTAQATSRSGSTTRSPLSPFCTQTAAWGGSPSASAARALAGAAMMIPMKAADVVTRRMAAPLQPAVGTKVNASEALGNPSDRHA